jgi:hypothetical protein
LVILHPFQSMNLCQEILLFHLHSMPGMNSLPASSGKLDLLFTLFSDVNYVTLSRLVEMHINNGMDAIDNKIKKKTTMNNLVIR